MINYPHIRDVKFTGRELRVIPYLLRGDTDKEIAEILKLERSTVSNYVYKVCKRAGVDTRSRFIVKFLPGVVIEKTTPQG